MVLNPDENPYDGSFAKEGWFIVNGHVDKLDFNLKLKGMKTDIEIEVEEMLEAKLPQ
jgi:hypothetical protein